MATKRTERSTVTISWPRQPGELALWNDLLLARALSATEGRRFHPGHHLSRAQSRLTFSHPALSDRNEGEKVLSVICDTDTDWSLDLVGTATRGGLRWTKGFARFLGAIEKDRERALHALADRPMLRAATRLAGQLGLSSAEAELLCVMAMAYADETLQDALAPHGVHRDIDLSGMLECLTRRSRRECLDLIGPHSSLRRLRLLKGMRLSVSDLGSPNLQPLLDGLINAENAIFDPLAHLVVPAVPGGLRKTDFGHLPLDPDLIVSVIRHAQSTRRAGVNVLLHGAPGTGKTELSRVLAREAGAAAFEVPLIDSGGDPRDGNSRLESLAMCHQALSQLDRPLIIFDEAEDLFPSPTYAWFFKSGTPLQKGWINQMLESNPVPTIWVANQVGHLDPAFLRRFDLVVEVPPPPREVRQRLVDELMPPGQIGAQWRVELAGLEDLSPDEIGRLARAGAHLQAQTPAQRERMLRRVFEQARRVTGRRSTPAHAMLPAHYRPELINADVDLVEVADNLAAARSGRLCLYGPPGSGKSAFAQHLAERIGISLMVRHASDLIDKYVGGTEKNLALAFTRASDEGALLLIDEADSFLQDRQRAQHSWEISHVNELLTQMERFQGVLVMCTNLFDQLDAAALRRFDLKLKLGYLRADQRLALLDECVNQYGLAGNDLEQQLARDRLSRLDRLTPGDFQTALRRRRLVKTDGVVGFVDALAAEQAGKRGAEARAIGFL